MPKFSRAPLVLASLFAAVPAMGQERAASKTLLTDGNFEVRAYPARRLAEMEVVGDLRLAAYNGFRIFADPTLPPGVGDELAALTTPVVETPAPSERFGTYPLFQLWDARVWTVSFQPPDGWTPGKLPNTRPPKIAWVEEPATRMAVLRFDGKGGVWDAGLGWRRAADELVTQAARHHLKTQGPLMIAQYNAPRTQSVFRHYEVMIALAPENPSPAPVAATPPR
jgi:hypothetical protein